jgi:hypothetical protein
MVTVSLDSPSCEVTLLILYSVVYRDVTRQAKGLYRLKHVGALWNGLTYLSRYNSGWFCHSLALGGHSTGELGRCHRVRRWIFDAHPYLARQLLVFYRLPTEGYTRGGKF